MHLLLCAATPFEIQPTIDFLEKENIHGTEVLVTGVGMMPAAYALARSISRKKPDLIIQAGLAGSFEEKLKSNQVVAVRDEIIGDLGVEEQGKFKSVFDLGLQDKDGFPWSGGRLRNEDPLLQSCGLPIVDSVTVNEISTNKERMGHYRELGVQIESMEGAALHYVALLERTRFLQLRAVSNVAGERDKSKWTLGSAIESLNRSLQELLTKILKP